MIIDSASTSARCCPHCDLLIQVRQGSAVEWICPRCTGLVREPGTSGFETPLACYLGAIICLALLYCFPIATIRAVGQSQSAALEDNVLTLDRYGLDPVAGVVLLTTIVIPALQVITGVWVLWPRRSTARSVAWKWCFRARQVLLPWSMLEIFMLGSIVAIVKLHGLARVILEPGAWLLIGFVLLHAGAEQSFKPDRMGAEGSA